MVAPPVVRPPLCHDSSQRTSAGPGSAVTGTGATGTAVSNWGVVLAAAAVCLMIGLIAVESYSNAQNRSQPFVVVAHSTSPTLPQPTRFTPEESSTTSEGNAWTVAPPKHQSTSGPAAIVKLDQEQDPANESVASLVSAESESDRPDAFPNLAELDPSQKDTNQVTPSFASQPSEADARVDFDRRHNPADTLRATLAARSRIKTLPTLGSRSNIIPHASPTEPAQCSDGTCQAQTRSLGTVLDWAETPAEAYREATESEKLVFLIHVSGNFEIPGFT